MTLKKWLMNNWLVAIIGAVFTVLLIKDAAGTGKALALGGQTFLSVAAILLTVFLFLGLFSVWVKEESIVKHFGEDSGWKGLFYGTLLGTIFHGPQVSIFPFLKSLQEKGARTAVLVAVVSAFAIKIPMLPLELALMGAKFTLIHNAVLFLTAPILALIMERALKVKPTLA
jgi:uncharacterized membrane protein YraQ (UPF0718 family)